MRADRHPDDIVSGPYADAPDRVAKVFGRGPRLIGTGAGEQNQKLLPAPANDRLRLSKRPPALVDERTQHPVAGFVAMPIVNEFEMIDIQQQDSRPQARRPRTLQRSGQAALAVAPV